MTSVQAHWLAKLRRHGYYTVDLDEADIPPEAKRASDEHTWGFEISGDLDTDNEDGRAYTQIQAHLAAAELLRMCADPKGWTATVVRLPGNECQCVGCASDEPEFEVRLVWSWEDAFTRGALADDDDIEDDEIDVHPEHDRGDDDDGPGPDLVQAFLKGGVN